MQGRKVDFLTEIRKDRLKKRRREPFQPTLFTRISAIVRGYGLTESFMTRLDVARVDLRVDVERMMPREKKLFLIPLYALVTEDEYRLIREILERVSNPYLAYAQSPEDIVFSETLHGRNPTLSPDRLLRWSFETLLMGEQAKEEVRELLAQEGARLRDPIRKRIEALEAFIARVEKG